MPTILSLSSQVAYGHVGHSAGVFAWQRLGIDVIALPTIMLSNRPDYPHASGFRVEPARLAEMLDALEANGRLERLDAVFTGYMPSADHVALVAAWLRRRKAERPDTLFMCDPILGDEPGGLYIPQAAAEALRDQLIPMADIAKPNRFELAWLKAMRVNTSQTAAEAASTLAPITLVTSFAEPAGTLTNMLITREGAWRTQVTEREHVPHGTGDLMAALFLAHILRGQTPAEALVRATAGVEAVVEASLGSDELRLVESQDRWSSAAPWPVQALEFPH